jgi:hypothetical protein
MFLLKNKNTGATKLTLDEVTEKLDALRIPISLVSTPTNLQSEKQKFLKSETYSPKFQYRIVKNKNNEIFADLLSVKEITDVDPRVSEFYIKLIQEKKLASDLMHAVGHNELFTTLSIQKFRMPNEKLLRNACRVMRGKLDGYNVLDTSKIPKGEYLTYRDVEKVFGVVFEEIGLGDWGVEKSKNITNNGVKTALKMKRVYVDPDIKKTPLELKKTVVHELTHVVRHYNGVLSGIKALGKPNLTNYLDVEEGLATWNEEQMGYLKDIDLKERAGAVYAIFIGEKLSFRELYNVLLGSFPRQKAFKITYLVKRGLGDTSLPGIYVKPVVYFRGYRKIRRRLESDASLYGRLYAGKISFAQVPWVEEGLIKEATIIPTKKILEGAFKKVGI